MRQSGPEGSFRDTGSSVREQEIGTGGRPGHPVVKTALPLQGPQVRSLVGELRSHMHGVCSVARKGTE